MASLLGKTALVTGSTSGIGLGIATALAREGAHVLMNGFGEVGSAKSLIEAAGSAYGARVLHHNADMSQATQIEALLAFASEEFGGIDVLVNNAGVQHVAPVQDFPAAEWDKVLAVNLTSAFHTTRLVLPHMLGKNWGRILNIASTHGLVASANKSAYVASKHGLVGLTKVVALETATTGVTCNAICPGWVLTPLVQKQVDAKAATQGISVEEAKRQLVGEKQPSQQFSTPEQLGALAVFLCSEAAQNVRGAAWNMDGGWVAQ